MKLLLLLAIISIIVAFGESMQCYSCKDELGENECGEKFDPAKSKKCTSTYGCVVQALAVKNDTIAQLAIQRGCGLGFSNELQSLEKEPNKQDVIMRIHLCRIDLCNDVQMKISDSCFSPLL